MTKQYIIRAYTRLTVESKRSVSQYPKIKILNSTFFRKLIINQKRFLDKNNHSSIIMYLTIINSMY